MIIIICNIINLRWKIDRLEENRVRRGRSATSEMGYWLLSCPTEQGRSKISPYSIRLVYEHETDTIPEKITVSFQVLF